MNNITIITGACVGVSTIFILGAYLKYKKIDIKDILTKLETFLKGAENYTSALEELATGKTQKALNFTSLLEKIGETATNYAAQLLISGQITDDADGTKRKEAALSYIYAFLEKEGIAIDDNVKTIATGIIESGVLSNKTIDAINTQIDKLIEEKVTTLQNEKTAIQTQLQQTQSQVSQLTAKNTQLTNAITTAASTVNATQSVQSTDTSTNSTTANPITIVNTSQPAQTA